jgi:lysine 2,3-aminomutase
MINKPAGPKRMGPHHKTLPRTVRLGVLTAMEDGSDDEPPGRTSLVTSLPTSKTNGNGHNGNGHHNGRSRARAHANGVAHRNGESKPAPAAQIEQHPTSDFVISDRTHEFRARCFPDITDAQWNDWKWQLRLRVRDGETLARVLHLTEDEIKTVDQLGGQLPVGITPYCASLLDRDDPHQGLRKTLVPTSHEFIHVPAEAEDPLAEDADSPVPGLVHRYPDRVLFLVTSFCAVYCRYCTRSRLVGKTGEYHFNHKQFQAAIDYIAAHPEIRDVLISGGDPLTMSDDKIEWLLSRLRAIPHLEFIRIGTKVPAVLPQRITPALCEMLKKYHPFWMSVHFMHPDEVTPEVAQACGRLADAGIPLGSQTVLTKGVNDDVETMKRLMHALLKIRVRPYYIYQCDPIPGSSHFRTPIEKGLEIIEALRGHTTGYAVPQFVIDGPGGGGKIPLQPNYLIGRDGDDVLLRNYEGKIFRYPDPVAS